MRGKCTRSNAHHLPALAYPTNPPSATATTTSVTMFSNFSSLLPNLSLASDKDQTPMNNSSTNPFDRLLAVKRRFDGTRTPVQNNGEPHTPEGNPSGTDAEADAEQEAEAQRTAALEKERKKKPLNEVCGCCFLAFLLRAEHTLRSK